jgi:hypothetical protein
VTRLIGFAIVAAGVAILFLPVSANRSFYGDTVACGSSWHAIFRNVNNYDSYGYVCGRAAFPHLWIAGGGAAVGGHRLLGCDPASVPRDDLPRLAYHRVYPLLRADDVQQYGGRIGPGAGVDGLRASRSLRTHVLFDYVCR